MTDQDARTALVAGGTGLVGRALLAALQQQVPAPVIHALARTPEGGAGAQDVQWHDWAWLENAAPVRSDIAFCCLGTTHAQAGSKAAFAAVDRDLVVRFAQRAHALGARRFGLVSSVGASRTARSHYLRIKGETEATLSGIGFDALHIMRPSLLLGSRDQRRVAEDAAQALAPLIGGLMVGAARRYKPVPATMVARQMVQAVLYGAEGVHLHYPWHTARKKNT